MGLKDVEDGCLAAFTKTRKTSSSRRQRTVGHQLWFQGLVLQRCTH